MTLSYDPPSVFKTASVTATSEANFLKPDSPISLPGTNCQIKSQVSLATLTSFRVGGPAEWYIAPRHLEDLQASFEWAVAEGVPITLLGAGSNLLVSDHGLDGLVICTRHLR